MAAIAGSFLRRKLSTFYKRTTLEVLQSLTDNETLIAVLSAQFGDYGMPPAQSSFAIHAVVAKHYLNGGAYPIGGSGEIFETIAPSILKNGGDIYINAGVTEILIENGDKAVGVKLKMERK